MIIHVGTGRFDPKKVPNGIDSTYFKGRTEELARVTSEPPLIKRKLYTYKSALQS